MKKGIKVKIEGINYDRFSIIEEKNKYVLTPESIRILKKLNIPIPKPRQKKKILKLQEDINKLINKKKNSFVIYITYKDLIDILRRHLLDTASYMTKWNVNSIKEIEVLYPEEYIKINK